MRPPKQAPTYRTILSAVLLGCLLFSSLVVPGQAAKPSNKKLQQKKASVQHNIKKVREQLHRVKVQEKQTRSQLSHTQHRVRVARGQLHSASLRLAKAQSELQHANQNFNTARMSFADSQERASNRIVASYMRGEEGYLEFLLTSTDFTDLLERLQLTRFMREQDHVVLAELRQRRENMARYQQQVQGKTQEVAVWKQQVGLLHQRTVQEQYRVTENLHDVKGKRARVEAEYAELMRESARISASLWQMQNSAPGRRRYNTRYTGAVGGLPTRGRITSPFGYRIHPIAKTRRMHTGVDIAAPQGTPITASGGGEVIFTGRRGGYGNTVMIDHGRGKTTLYAHMSAINARNGQVVKRGQVIGWVGSTGYSTGPHLHYEVRINGKPVNPL